jgi:N-acetylglucosamine-6-phosphate deacetylase
MICLNAFKSLISFKVYMKIIDIHTHGLNGIDSRSDDVLQILNIAKMQAAQGVSQIILSIYPAAIEVMRSNLSVIKKAMDIAAKDYVNEINNDIKISSDGKLVFPPTAVISGVHLEGPFLNPMYCGALNAASFLEPLERHFERLIEGYNDIVKIITIAPELNGAVKFIKKITDMGIIVNMGHSDADYAQAEDGFNAGAKGVTHLFNAMRPFKHREPGLVGFALTNKDIYVEVIADPFHLHQSTIELIFKTKLPDRIIIVSDSVKQTTHTTFNKSPIEVSGRLLGGAMGVTEAVKRLINLGFPPETTLECISANPLRFLKD